MNLGPIMQFDDVIMGRRSIRGFLDRHETRIVEFAELPGGLDPFFNVNTPEDFLRAQQILEQDTA